MSTSSDGAYKRINSLQHRGRLSRNTSATSKNYVSRYDAYTFALRAAYLCHLLQPRTKRLQHVAAPPKQQVQRSSASVSDLVKDFSGMKDSKSTRFPQGFMAELDKRIEGVLVNRERLKEYNDAQVKRTFAAFLNEFKRPDFRKNVDQDRKVEPLLLRFYSSATKELMKGKAADDDSWKLMVDRHSALFVRLISSTLKSSSHDWARDRPELTNRLQTLESKLLVHDQDLAATSQRNGGSGGTTTEVEVPRSQNVKDMPLIVTVAGIFEKPLPQVQADIDDQKEFWTEKAALKDLKMYQTNLNLDSPRTLRSDDFDTHEAYEAWKKSENPDLSQMMLALIQSNPELAKSVPGSTPQMRMANSSSGDPSASGDGQRFIHADETSPYAFDQPVDMSALNLTSPVEGHPVVDDSDPYMFIPPEPRAYYRAVLKEALAHDLAEQHIGANGVSVDHIRLFSKRNAELLNELGLRWRLPYVSRMMLVLDVVREKFTQQQVDLDTLDAAFNYVREPPADKKKPDMSLLFDRSRWTMADFSLNQQVLNSVHDTLLRDLYEQLLQCYESKPPNIGPIMTVLEEKIYDDPIFSRTAEDLDRFSASLAQALRGKAAEHYHYLFEKEVGQYRDKLEFWHIIQLGKAVQKFCERIQKRYRKNPVVMGVEPAKILVEAVFPSFAADAEDQIALIQQQASQDPEGAIPIQDGFDMYKEMVGIRRLYAEVLPNVPFPLNVEDELQNFVWRWIQTTDSSVIGWVEGAVNMDQFQVRAEDPASGPMDDERHSVSVIDIFRSFNQAIDQVLSLQWDNDVHYAKFMTALSKSVGSGVQRYCEMLEQRFAKEMDRLTPAQEAALQQSRQEKWMQLAKDAMSTKEKVEPFHFFPESFVKLNNIEYAMLQFDKIEKEMNVDACVDVIKRNEPQQPRKRRGEKFVFTIKIIEAEDLKACDPNGLSDPYVVLGDEFQKRLAKTRIVYANLNPRWDETVDITTTGLLSVTATIWDWDVMGDHDCVGRTTIKLDPSHFSDYLPREYWLDLDTQGRLLVRITMEGEKDDIQFYFGRAFRALKRTERDMARKITDKVSAYIHHCLSRRVLRALTRQTNISVSNISSSALSFIGRGPAAPPKPISTRPSDADIAAALKPLFSYLDENFAIMQQTLTSHSMITVMTRVWKEVLATVEGLLVPPLSDKPSTQQQLTEPELDVVFRWLTMLFNFFHAVDEETGQANGVPLDVLKSTKYHDLQNLNFFYYEPTENLIRTSERMASSQTAGGAAPQVGGRLASGGSAPMAGQHALPSLPTASATRRNKSVMASRNLGTMRKAKSEKRAAAQAEPSDDMILRILRMRPEAGRYLRDRARQRERLAAAAAAEYIVKQSLARQEERLKGLTRPGQGMGRTGSGGLQRKAVGGSR